MSTGKYLASIQTDILQIDEISRKAKILNRSQILFSFCEILFIEKLSIIICNS